MLEAIIENVSQFARSGGPDCYVVTFIRGKREAFTPIGGVDFRTSDEAERWAREWAERRGEPVTVTYLDSQGEGRPE
jgi:hypothetical protein